MALTKMSKHLSPAFVRPGVILSDATLLLLFHKDADFAVFQESEMKYVKGEDKYIPIGRTKEYNFNSDVKQIFPRVWDSSEDQYHAQFYAEWLNLGYDQQSGKYEAPSYGDNIQWFFTYQMSHMYWRYFMWNFAGKQNDIQGLGNKRDGNWISGFSFVDNKRIGDQSQLPDSIKNNKAHNQLYLLPFVLGIIGCVYQFLKNRKDWIVNFLLFFFTGIAVVLYLNQPGNMDLIVTETGSRQADTRDTRAATRENRMRG